LFKLLFPVRFHMDCYSLSNAGYCIAIHIIEDELYLCQKNTTIYIFNVAKYIITTQVIHIFFPTIDNVRQRMIWCDYIRYRLY